MNVELIEVERKSDEIFFNVYDKDTNSIVGILFTVGDEIAYEIKPEFRCQGAATQALMKIISKINRPVLSIMYDNIASMRVAEKAGFTLIRSDKIFQIYHYNGPKK